MSKAINSTDKLEFAVFCIESIAVNIGVDADKVYDALAEKSSLLDDYIIANYEVLHSLSKEYIVNDILNVMNEKGIEI